MNTNDKPQESKHVYSKFFGILLAGAVTGGVLGTLSFLVSSFWDNAGSRLAASTSPLMLPLFIILCGGLLLIAFGVYRKARKAVLGIDLDADLSPDTENTLSQVDRWINLSVLFSSLSLILDFVFLAVLEVAKDENALLAVVLFLLFVALSTVMQVLPVNLLKKVNPEKRGNPLDFSFQKIWLSTCDEGEKFTLYQAAYKTYRLIQNVLIGLMLVTLMGNMYFDTGIFPVILIAILWGAQTVAIYVYSRNGLSAV